MSADKSKAARLANDWEGTSHPVIRELAAELRSVSDSEMSMIALREWAVSRWRAEVEHRPLTNAHRRTLDDTWRQVMRYAGLDPEDAVGPAHDELVQRALSTNPLKEQA